MPFIISNKGIRIHYETAGDGPPLVLQHGFTGTGKDWQTFGFVDGLSDHFRLIMPDARGHGQSDKPHDPSAYSLETIARDIVALLDALDLAQAHYYGYSYGGSVGWALGMIAPERFASMTIGGAHPFRPEEALRLRAEAMREHLALGMDDYVAWRESHGAAWPAEFRERVLQNDARALLAFLTAEFESREHLRLDEALHRMMMPVLVVSGDDDELFAGLRARQAAAMLRDGRFLEIENADHAKLYLRGDLIAPHLMEFVMTVVDGRPVAV